ncbi:hypothetical protein QJS10_CPA01g01867 [Acorus calamus]|uniref:Uncharacterized protein n=1 Tax=Acorus calamus TaxID=4465 RepID=A0AAV9FQU7_ACOCL|nr:hypothetical protein QJS10_CPA01g01867 [Acorus calamus]
MLKRSTSASNIHDQPKNAIKGQIIADIIADLTLAEQQGTGPKSARGRLGGRLV